MKTNIFCLCSGMNKPVNLDVPSSILVMLLEMYLKL